MALARTGWLQSCPVRDTVETHGGSAVSVSVKGEGSGFDSWSEKWRDLAEKGRVLTEDLETTISEASQAVIKEATKATAFAKESIEERKRRKMVEGISKEVDELVAVSSQEPVDEAEVERLRVRVATLEVRQRELESLIDDMDRLVDDIPRPTEEPQEEPEDSSLAVGLGFIETITQTPTLIGFAVLWALLLVFSAAYVEDKGIEVAGISAGPMVWVVGGMVWAFVVLTQISKVGSFPILPLSFRIQSTIGVGVATASISLIPGIADLSAMFHIFSWLVIVALTVLIISSIMNGFRSISKK
jgi:hypothetical protein